jgi:hypothetical protein
VANSAVIGAGYLGKFHAEKYASLKDCEWVAVVDINAEAAQQVAEKRLAENTTKITNYIVLFNSNVGRNPENDELRDALNETVEANILANFMETYDQMTYTSGANNV